MHVLPVLEGEGVFAGGRRGGRDGFHGRHWSGELVSLSMKRPARKNGERIERLRERWARDLDDKLDRLTFMYGFINDSIRRLCRPPGWDDEGLIGRTCHSGICLGGETSFAESLPAKLSDCGLRWT